MHLKGKICGFFMSVAISHYILVCECTFVCLCFCNENQSDGILFSHWLTSCAFVKDVNEKIWVSIAIAVSYVISNLLNCKNKKLKLCCKRISFDMVL
jgi:hypothetical protein